MNERNELPQLPKGWAWTVVGEVAQLLRGVSYDKAESSKESRKGFVPILRANNIKGELNFDDLVYVPPTRVKAEQFVKAFDILIAMSSGSKDLVGKAAQAKQDFLGAFGTFCGLVRSASKVDKRFVGYYFQSPYYRREVSRLSSGININNLRREHIEAMPISLPPLPEQHRIVVKVEELFSDLDAGVAALRKIQTQLKRYRQAVLKAAVEGKLTAEWRAANVGKIEPASALLERIRAERAKYAKWKERPFPQVDVAELPELPEGWCWVRVGEISLVVSGQTPKDLGEHTKEKGVPFYKVSDMNREGNKELMNESAVYLSENEIDDLGIRIMGKGTIIFPKRGGAIATNKKRILTRPSAYDLNLMGIQPVLIPWEYVYHWISGIDLITLSDGSNVPQINHTDIDPLPIPLPPLAEQQQIVAEVERRLSVADEVERTVDASLKQAARLRQSILKRAFAGKLVPQDPSDEPAERLLERIRATREKGHAQGVPQRKPQRKRVPYP